MGVLGLRKRSKKEVSLSLRPVNLRDECGELDYPERRKARLKCKKQQRSNVNDIELGIRTDTR